VREPGRFNYTRQPINKLAIPFEPKLVKQGSEAFLVSYSDGVLKDIPGIEKIRQLPSFRCERLYLSHSYRLFYELLGAWK
jgi:hypothetical protein